MAMSDPLRLVASPLVVLDADTALGEIKELVEQYRPDLIVVGLPLTLSGREGPSSEGARALASAVAEVTGVPTELVDERFTTTGAERALIEGNVKRRDRRHKVDKVAAALILQHYLDRRT